MGIDVRCVVDMAESIDNVNITVSESSLVNGTISEQPTGGTDVSVLQAYMK